ncbi:MAG: lysostaphin resistance A-like protein, partial [Pirellulales bacterium]
GMLFREARFSFAFPWRIVPALLVVSFGAAILLVEMALWIPMPESLRRSMTSGSEQVPFLTMFIPMVILAPLAEEFFFRGLLLRDYLERYSIRKSVWATAIVFALFHLNPWQAAVALPLGLWFAWLVLRTGSLIPGVICHAVHNFSTAFVFKPLAIALGYTAKEWQAAVHLPPKLLAVGAVLAFGGGALLWRQLAGSNAVVIDTSGPITEELDVLLVPDDSAQEIIGLDEFESASKT